MGKVPRRTALKQLSAVTVLGLASMSLARIGRAQTVKEIHELKPGEFVWHPERASDGPVSIIVSLPDQLVHVYRNGIRIGVSTCSSGKPGHVTPTGVFTILEKDRNHHSSTYNNAPMPNMNRLTWSGVALHAGNLPGYPASHGCIRLPMKFSELLFGVTHVGTPVIVAGTASTPIDIVHPGLVLATDAERELEAAAPVLKQKPNPWQAQVNDFSAPVSLVLSSADQTATLLQKGDIVVQGKLTLRDPGQPLGSHVFILTGVDGKDMKWQAIAHHASAGATLAAPEADLLQRIAVDKPVLDAMKERMHPGMILLTTDLPAEADTRTGKDFVIMAQDEA